MKNLEIIIMVNSGILNITNHELPASSAYKIVKFRNVLQKAFDNIQELEKSLLKDNGIEDPQKFDEDRKKLHELSNPTEDERKELEELDKKYDSYNKARSEMLQDESRLEGIKTISYEDWHTLRKENRPKKDGDIDPLNNYVESVLENVLWKAPEE